VYIVFLPLDGTRNVVETLPLTAPIIRVRDLPLIESERRRGAGGKKVAKSLEHLRPGRERVRVCEGNRLVCLPRGTVQAATKKYRVGGALGSLSALWTDLVYLTEAGAQPLRDLLRG
jgi:hypothetical protein